MILRTGTVNIFFFSWDFHILLTNMKFAFTHAPFRYKHNKKEASQKKTDYFKT